jgi:hypothetical protein
MEPLCSKLLLHKEEGQETMTSIGLSTSEQMNQEKLQHIPSHPICH